MNRGTLRVALVVFGVVAVALIVLMKGDFSRFRFEREKHYPNQ